MGEYATRKSDGERVKIGTCENMYYLRYEDRGKVKKEPNNLDPNKEKGLFWRLPFPDEDDVKIGEYEDYNRGYGLWKPIYNALGKQISHEDFTLDDMAVEPGSIQLKHECGVLLSIPCHHGTKLPDAPDGWRIGWNGKSPHLELTSVKNNEDEIRFVVRCRFCEDMWSFTWADIKEFVHGEMKERLESYL